MESPLKRYKYLSTIDNIHQIAYNTLFDKYIIKNDKNDDKLWELDSTDQEGLIRNFNGGYPLPGFIYTFIYPPQENDNINIIYKGKEEKYVDFVPIVFCMSIEKDGFKGINLNTLPNTERLKFLDVYYTGYQKFFKDIEKLTENDKIALNKAYITSMGSDDGKDLIKIFNKIANANFGYGYRHYKLKRIRNFRMIEYAEWNYIPFYDPKHAFKLLNQKKIHELYWKTL